MELPYASDTLHQPGDCALVCLLPKARTLDQALSALTAEGLAQLHDGLDASKVVSLTMPRFAFDFNWEFKKTCETLGLKDAFDPRRAVFSRMYQGDAPSPIWIDETYQAAMISVDEKGTEAATTTAVVQVGGMDQREVVLDRPFLFLPRDLPTGVVPFLGWVADPRE